MNPEDSNKWNANVLGHILMALAASKKLKNVLIYKGALILNKRLGTNRMSLDIDSNLFQDFVMIFPEKNQQKDYLAEVFKSAISKYFNRQDPVRFELSDIKIRNSPPKIEHPLGWNGFSIKIKVTDFENIHVRNLPSLSIDVAAPENLSKNSISDIDLGGHVVSAYTLERIAGEKMRAFLSTLPAYRAKVKKPGEAIRVKDLYDLTRIQRIKPIQDELFWEIVGEEFKMACSSRYIDCEGIGSFKENWENTRSLYETDQTLPDDTKFDEVDKVITNIIAFFSLRQITPFVFPLPLF